MGISSRLVVTLLVLMFISLCASGIVPRQNIAGRCGKPYRGAGLIIGAITSNVVTTLGMLL